MCNRRFYSGLRLTLVPILLIAASSDHVARLWELATGETVRQYNGHHRSVSSSIFLEMFHPIDSSSPGRYFDALQCVRGRGAERYQPGMRDLSSSAILLLPVSTATRRPLYVLYQILCCIPPSVHDVRSSDDAASPPTGRCPPVGSSHIRGHRLSRWFSHNREGGGHDRRAGYFLIRNHFRAGDNNFLWTR